MIYFPQLELVKSVQTAYRYIDTNHFILPIPKNGSCTISHFSRMNEGIENITMKDLDSNGKYEIDVFLRDPLDRFYAGMVTAFYKSFQKSRDRARLVSLATKWVFVDRHLIPQYFFMLNCFDQCPDSMLTFHSYKKISPVLKTDIQENITKDSHKKQMMEWIGEHGSLAMEHGDERDDAIVKIYHPDKIMWNEFLGKTMHFNEIRERFNLEKEYFKRRVVGWGF